MARAAPTSSQSLAVSAVGFVILVALLQFQAELFAATSAGTLLGGLLASFVFFFAFVGLSNALETVFGVKRVGWATIIVSLLIALIVAGSVHRVSVTSCFLFSAALFYYTNICSQSIYSTRA